jgi:hypothetical protein
MARRSARSPANASAQSGGISIKSIRSKRTQATNGGSVLLAAELSKPVADKQALALALPAKANDATGCPAYETPDTLVGWVNATESPRQRCQWTWRDCAAGCRDATIPRAGQTEIGHNQMRSKSRAAWETAARCATLAQEADDPQEREYYARLRNAWITLAKRCEFFSVSEVRNFERSHRIAGGAPARRKNLTAAAAAVLGWTDRRRQVPPTLLAVADEVIE